MVKVKKVKKQAAPAKEEKAAAKPKEETKPEEEKQAQEENKAKQDKKPKVAKAPKSEAKPKAEATPNPEKEKLAKQAIDEILAGIEVPGGQDKGAFIPQSWKSRYKQVLGAYQKFLHKLPEMFTVHPRGNGDFFITKAGEKPTYAQLVRGQTWQWLLETAWNSYCANTEEGKRYHGNFKGKLAGTFPAKKGNNENKRKAEPEAEPKDEGKPAGGGKKKKAKKA